MKFTKELAVLIACGSLFAASSALADIWGASVSPYSAAQGTTVSIRWQTSSQHHYQVALLDNNRNKINTSTYMSGNCIANHSTGADGCIRMDGNSKATSETWTIPSQVAPGDYWLKVVVWDTSLAATAEYVRLTVTAPAVSAPPPLGTPDGLLPANGQSITNSPFAFQWNAVSGATKYRVQVTKDSIFTTSADGNACYNCVDIGSGETTSTSYPVSGFPFEKGNLYRWRVRAGNATSGSEWSQADFVVPVQLDSPSLPSPADGVTVGATPSFSWGTVAGATSYRIQVTNGTGFLIGADDKTCTNCIINESTSKNTLVPAQTLAAGVYKWRVRAGSSTLYTMESGWLSGTFTISTNASVTTPITSITATPLIQNVTCPPLIQNVSGAKTGTAIREENFIPDPARRLNLVLAEFLAKVSDDVYQNPGSNVSPAATLCENGFENIRFVSYSGGSTNVEKSLQAIVATRTLSNNRNVVLLAFRGTENWDDIVVDLLALVKNGVHTGFGASKQAFKNTENRLTLGAKTLQQIVQNASANDIFIVTGHSLGGAIAELYAMDMFDRTGKNDITLYTFGAPFTNKLLYVSTINQMSIRDRYDPVPYLTYVAGFPSQGRVVWVEKHNIVEPANEQFGFADIKLTGVVTFDTGVAIYTATAAALARQNHKLAANYIPSMQEALPPRLFNCLEDLLPGYFPASSRVERTEQYDKPAYIRAYGTGNQQGIYDGCFYYFDGGDSKWKSLMTTDDLNMQHCLK